MATEITPYRRPMHSKVRNKPDYLYWRTKDQWSLNEACKLICGRDPVHKYPTPQDYNKGKKVIDIIDHATDAVRAKELRALRDALISIHIQVEPGEFVRWAISNGYEIAPDLEDLKGAAPGAAANVNETIKDRILTIARTLMIVTPGITINEIHLHAAMRRQIGQEMVPLSTLENWLIDSNF